VSTVAARDVEYKHNQTRMLGYFASDTAVEGPRPGVLIVHEASGIGKHVTNIAARIAGLGYAALAIDLWGERRQLADMTEAMDMIGKVAGDNATWMGRVEAARQALNEQPETDGSRTAAIGYCFGGATVLEFARTGGDVLGVASFHGGLDAVGPDWSSAQTESKLLVSTGADDPMVPLSSLATLQERLAARGLDWEIDIFGGTKHSFTNPEADGLGMPDALAYNAQTDKRSWDRLCSFLAEIF